MKTLSLIHRVDTIVSDEIDKVEGPYCEWQYRVVSYSQYTNNSALSKQYNFGLQ